MCFILESCRGIVRRVWELTCLLSLSIRFFIIVYSLVKKTVFKIGLKVPQVVSKSEETGSILCGFMYHQQSRAYVID